MRAKHVFNMTPLVRQSENKILENVLTQDQIMNMLEMLELKSLWWLIIVKPQDIILNVTVSTILQRTSIIALYKI